jgi:hypothetical protein
VDLPELERLMARALLAPADARRMAELEDALARGCLAALANDARCRLLGERLHDAEPLAPGEAMRLADQRRALEASTRRLRARLREGRAAYARAVGLRAGSSANGSSTTSPLRIP